MRRFITSLTGKVVGQVVILALLLPFITLALYNRAVAQVAVLPQWAVVQFHNQVSPGTSFGKTASDAIVNELVKSGHYDPIPADTIDRTVREMGISNPPDNATDLLRLAEEVHATSAVTGDILSYRIFHENGGKYAVVQMTIAVYDVASGVAVNGAAVRGQSVTKTGDVPDETVISDAIVQAANSAIGQIRAQSLPFGTVLNTGVERALINKGARSGFKVGQLVIVLRNREQVATARVSEVEPDASYIHIERSNKGMQPGDVVRAVWEVPAFKFSGIDRNGNTPPVQVHHNPNNSGLITTLLIVGLVGAVLVGGGATDTGVTANVVAEPLSYPQIGGVPGVRVSWTPNQYAKGNSEIAAWQIWRNDVTDGPVLVVPQGPNDAVDFSQVPLLLPFLYTQGVIGGQTCVNTAPTNNTSTTIGLVPGHPYIYSVELVYGLNIIDLPGAGTAASSTSTAGGTSTATSTSTASSSTSTSTASTTTGGTTGGSTGTLTTGTTSTATTSTATTSTATTSTATTSTSTATTTGTTATGTTATAGTICYFLSSRQNAVGLATPLNAPVQQTPANNFSAPANTAISFTASSVASDPTYTLVCQYVLQLSTSPNFPAATTVTIGPTTSNAAGGAVVTVATVDTTSAVPSYIATASTFYWRIGARNAGDNPGPVKDVTTGQRYIFSSYRTLTRPGTPPGNPGIKTKTTKRGK